jgi:UDP-N-acetyl-D-glucosamine dehydrogenase
MVSASLDSQILKKVDCVLVVTDHTEVDYNFVAQCANLVVDTRGVVPNTYGNVVEA